MATTTEFEEWLENIEDDDIEIINNLYESVEFVTQMGEFTCTENNGKLFIQTDDNELTLMLASDKAVKTFLKKLDDDYGGDFHSVVSEWEFYRSMRKDD